MKLKRVVVTGLGAVSPIGNDVPTLWENAINGVSGAGPITRFDSYLFKTQFACEVKGFDPTSCMDRRDVRKVDVHTQFGVAAAVEAINDSGLVFEQEDCYRIGVVYGEGVGGFNSMHALSVRNDDPQGASRPFSKSRDGFVIGEGAACLILEEYEHAVARGAKIYAEIVGTGLTADAHHITLPHPEGEGAYRVMKAVLEEAGISPEDVDYINVHGTSTPAGDIAEVKAIKNLFGEHAYKLNISSTKSMTGHLLGAAGALEALLTVLSVKNDVIPPTINHADGDDDPNIDYSMNFTFNKAQKKIVNVAISNTFGFGGHNASIAFRKFEG